MNPNVQAGVVQLAIAVGLVAFWYSGAWQVIVDELRVGLFTAPRRIYSPGDAGKAPAVPPVAPGATGGQLVR